MRKKKSSILWQYNMYDKERSKMDYKLRKIRIVREINKNIIK